MLGLPPLLGKPALKLANKGINERSLQHELIGKDLCHRHFVKVYECSDVWIHAEACPGLTFEKKSLLMELCQGASLAELTLHQANLSGRALEKEWLERCRTFMVSMTFAVIYMHQMGVVHRDLSPQNVLLKNIDKHGTDIKLTDFGSAARLPFGH